MKLTNRYLEESSSVVLKMIKCYLLQLLGYRHYSLHEVFELEQQRLTLSDEFAIFSFMKDFEDVTITDAS